MEQPSDEQKDQKMRPFLLRMSEPNYEAMKRVSQRMGASMTSLINVVIDDYVKNRKI